MTSGFCLFVVSVLAVTGFLLALEVGRWKPALSCFLLWIAACMALVGQMGGLP